MSLYLAPPSVVGLCILVLATALAAYLFAVPDKSTATKWLTTAMASHVVFLAVLFLLLSSVSEAQNLLNVVQLVAWFVALTATMGFAYHFIENSFPREWKWAVGAGGLTTVVWAVLLPLFLTGILPGTAVLVNTLLASTVAALTAWTIIVFLRKARRFSRADRLDTGARPVPSGRAARAHLAFGFLNLMLLAVAVLIGVTTTGVVTSDLANTLIMAGFLAYFFSVAVIYVNHASEPTTFQVKVVSFALASVVAVLALTTLVVFDQVDLARASGVPMPHAPVRFEPDPDGGYRIAEVDEPLEISGGRTLDMGNGDAPSVDLPFSFPFGDAAWDSLYVDDDGFVSFGEAYTNLAAFETADQPLIAPFFAALFPNRGGRVWTKVDSSRAVFTWDRVPEQLAQEPVTVQLELRPSGAITFRYGYIAPTAVSSHRGLFPRGRRGDEIEVPARDHHHLPGRLASGAALLQSFDEAHRLYVHQRVASMAWLVLGATLFVLVVFPFLLRSSITRPLKGLLEGVRRVNAGDLNTKVSVTVRDEIGYLAHNFNQMTGTLQKAEERLRAHASELEARVQDRTRDLERSLEELRSMQAQLVQQEKMASLGALTAGIAHEIKNPLNFVNNFAALSVELAEEFEEELLALKPKVGDDMDDLEAIIRDLKLNAEKINEHGRRADGIVKSMLQHSRDTSGARQETDLNELLSEYVNLAYHGMRAQDARFNCRIDWDLDEDVGLVNLVPQDMGRVFINLLNNAFYAVSEKARTVDGPYEPAVWVGARRGARDVVVTISDNGPGIPPAQREQIFEPFFTTKPAGSGTGLGLSLSYDIVTQEHGGQMEVDSTVGEETSFTIRLPLTAPGARRLR